MKIKAGTMTLSILFVLSLSFGYCLTQKEIVRGFWAMTAGNVDKETQKKIDEFDNSTTPLSFPDFGALLDRIVNPFKPER